MTPTTASGDTNIFKRHHFPFEAGLTWNTERRQWCAKRTAAKEPGAHPEIQGSLFVCCGGGDGSMKVKAVQCTAVPLRRLPSATLFHTYIFY